METNNLLHKIELTTGGNVWLDDEAYSHYIGGSVYRNIHNDNKPNKKHTIYFEA